MKAEPKLADLDRKGVGCLKAPDIEHCSTCHEDAAEGYYDGEMLGEWGNICCAAWNELTQESPDLAHDPGLEVTHGPA